MLAVSCFTITSHRCATTESMLLFCWQGASGVAEEAAGCCRPGGREAGQGAGGSCPPGVSEGGDEAAGCCRPGRREAGQGAGGSCPPGVSEGGDEAAGCCRPGRREAGQGASGSDPPGVSERWGGCGQLRPTTPRVSGEVTREDAGGSGTPGMRGGGTGRGRLWIMLKASGAVCNVLVTKMLLT